MKKQWMYIIILVVVAFVVLFLLNEYTEFQLLSSMTGGPTSGSRVIEVGAG